MEKIEIGKVVAAQGIKGEVRIKSFAESASRFSKVKTVFLVKGKDEKKLEIEKSVPKGALAICKLSGVETRNDAEALRGYMVYMDEADLEELPDGSFYVRDLIGMEVTDYGSGKRIGVLKDVLTDRPQDIYVVQKDGDQDGSGQENRGKDGGGKEIMIPAVDEFIKEIDPDGRVIKVSLIEGMDR